MAKIVNQSKFLGTIQLCEKCETNWNRHNASRRYRHL